MRQIRKDFGKQQNITVPYLLGNQRESYQEFLQSNCHPLDRKDIGLYAAFKAMFPMGSARGDIQIEYVDYRLEPPAFTTVECKARGKTYASKLYVSVRLVMYENLGDMYTLKVSGTGISEQEIYLCDIPLMTDAATFIINGTERVVVAQLHRSPGVFLGQNQGIGNTINKKLFSARVIPSYGSWLDLEFNAKDLLYMSIDRNRKIHVTILLRALGYTTEDMLQIFFDWNNFYILDRGLQFEYNSERIIGMDFPFDIIVNGDVIVPEGRRVTRNNLRKMIENGITGIHVPDSYMYGQVLAHNIVNPETKNVIAEANEEITPSVLEDMRDNEIDGFSTIHTTQREGAYISRTLAADTITTQNDAQITIYKILRVGESATQESASILFHDLFFNSDRYDLSAPGRKKLDVKLNRKLDSSDVEYTGILYDAKYIKAYLGYEEKEIGLNQIDNIDENWRLRENVYTDSEEILIPQGIFVTNQIKHELEKYEIQSVIVFRTKKDDERLIDALLKYDDSSDIIDVIRTLIAAKNNESEDLLDDIDHIGNRRVRNVGEMMEIQFRSGLLGLKRSIRDKLEKLRQEDLAVKDLIDAKSVTASIMAFFNSGPLSQYMDQENSLSSISHKRRISALGPGGLTRERAGLEVRDIHPTHYGKICPIETPEGANIGIINSLALYARTNTYGFLESPYYKVVNGEITDQIEYLSAVEEGQYIIAPTGSDLKEKKNLIACRYQEEAGFWPADRVQYVNVSPKQLVSVAAALIPFLEHNDANRALMGSNMQRQAVPVIKPEKPLVGTGMERNVAIDSGDVVVADHAGIVDSVDASRIVIHTKDPKQPGVDIYNLVKYTRSNQNTCINQLPLVKPGDVVHAKDVLADGSATNEGELALGQNMLVAFMPWHGYNFEDSILISERVAEQDRYTSIHIEELTCNIQDTNNGPEDITTDIPGVSAQSLSKLDDSGIVYIGARVKAGDILVGKVTPRDDAAPTPEEKLLFAVFGESASKVKETSLRVPSGMDGTIIDVQVLVRSNAPEDARIKQIRSVEIENARKDFDDHYRILANETQTQVENLLNGQKLIGIKDKQYDEIKITKKYLKGVNPKHWSSIRVKDNNVNKKIAKIYSKLNEQKELLDKQFQNKKDRILMGDDLPSGTLKMVKVYLAVKRHIQPGDKLAGRHGNKGVISKVIPIEDMPFLEDGTPVDMVLNPLGVVSRMNIGQILEIHLGWAAKELGTKVSTMLDTNIKVSKLRKFLKAVYNGSANEKLLYDMKDDQIYALAKSLRSGVPMATPIFDGASEKDIQELLALAELPRHGQIQLFDGRTGEPFDRFVTVGYMYIMKLNHLVDDKMHARSTGPYSLVTQQPLGGKAQFGGQRFGEMEVWALEAHGAAYTLQEMLTVKSDDVSGRGKMYKNIIAGSHQMDVGIPESFKVLLREIRSAGLDIDYDV